MQWNYFDEVTAVKPCGKAVLGKHRLSLCLGDNPFRLGWRFKAGVRHGWLVTLLWLAAVPLTAQTSASGQQPRERTAQDTSPTAAAALKPSLGTTNVLAGKPTSASPDRAGARESRVWVRADGVRLPGVFVGRHGSVIALREDGGRNVFWTWAQVSPGDRDFLARQYGVFGPPGSLSSGAGPTRQQTVAARMARVAARAEPPKAPAEGAATAAPDQGSER